MILMTSKPMVITGIKKKTKAQFFCALEVGDVLEFSVPIKNPGHGRTLYATYITVSNMKTGMKTQASFTQLSSLLECFEVTETA